MKFTSNTVWCRCMDRLHLTILNCGRATVGDEWHGFVTAPTFSRLYHIESGAATIRTIDGAPFPLEAGRWYLLPAGCSFAYNCRDTLDHMYFHLKLSDIDESDRLCAFEVPRRLNTLLPPAAPLYNRESLQTFTQALQLRHCVDGVLAALMEEYDIHVQNSTYSPCMLRALQYITQHLSMQLTVPVIAQHALVSTATLTKQFRKELSVSVGDYIDKLVLSEAQRLLMAEEISIGAISDKLGFSDQFYFSRRFKHCFGVSPREYRKQKS